jgi:hypothetical protein
LVQGNGDVGQFSFFGVVVRDLSGLLDADVLVVDDHAHIHAVYLAACSRESTAVVHESSEVRVKRLEYKLSRSENRLSKHVGCCSAVEEPENRVGVQPHHFQLDVVGLEVLDYEASALHRARYHRVYWYQNFLLTSHYLVAWNRLVWLIVWVEVS